MKWSVRLNDRRQAGSTYSAYEARKLSPHTRTLPPTERARPGELIAPRPAVPAALLYRRRGGETRRGRAQSQLAPIRRPTHGWDAERRGK